MSIEQTIGREHFDGLEAVIQNAINRKDMTGVMRLIETTLEMVFLRGQENSIVIMQAAGVPLKGVGVKKNTTELVTADLVGDLKEGEGFHMKSGNPNVLHAESASGEGVEQLIKLERDRERRRIRDATRDQMTKDEFFEKWKPVVVNPKGRAITLVAIGKLMLIDLDSVIAWGMLNEKKAPGAKE